MRLNNILKRLLPCMTIVVAAWLPLPAVSQDLTSLTPLSDKDVYVVYINKDNQGPTNEAIKATLRNIYRQAKGNIALFYFADGREPIIGRLNPNDGTDEFEEKILRAADSSISAQNVPFDHRRLLEILTQMQLVDNEGYLRCMNLELDFCVCKTFWEGAFNEKLIAALFFELGLSRFQDRNQLRVNVFYPQENTRINSDYPFGRLAPDALNSAVTPKPYLQPVRE